MRPETFFEKFELLADAPDAVAKMRELVLRMATSGRIAEQDPADQPASELLKEIFEARDNLIKRGAAKSRTEGNPIPAGDTIDLPPSWSRCMISEVCDLQTGATPSRMEHSYFGGDIPWLVSGDINKVEITECDGRITKEGLENSNCRIIPADSVLIALNGQGKTRATVALLRMPAALNQSLVAMIPYSRERLLPEYIFWNLRGRYYAIREITGQDQRRGLNMKLVGQLSLPVPPLAEQRRIVAKVDELMALCDRLEAQLLERETWHAALAHASLARFAEAPTPDNVNLLFHKSYSILPADLRKSILTLAVQGKLVPQDTYKVQPLASRGAEIDEPFEVPDNWEWVRLGDLQPEFQNGASSRGDRYGKQVIVIRLADVRNRRIALDSPRAIVISNEQIAKYELRAGDTLITRVNGSADIVGTFVPVPHDLDAIYCDHFIRMRIDPSRLDPGYTALLGESQLVRDQIKSLFVTTAGQKTVNQSHIGALRIALPPLTEQRRIVAKVDELMTLVDALENQIVTARATGTTLVEAVVSELTAQV